MQVYVNVNFCSSQAPLVPSELFHSLANAVQFVVTLIRNTVASYNYFIPELGITTCMYSYMSEQYPELRIYEYPGQILEDIVKGVERMISEEKLNKGVENALVYEDKEQDEDVPNSTVDTYYNEADNEIFGSRALESPRYIGRSQAVLATGPSVKWQTCSKIYAMESVVRYIIVNVIL